MMIDTLPDQNGSGEQKIRCRKCSDAVDFTCGKRGAYDEYHSLFCVLYAKNVTGKDFAVFAVIAVMAVTVRFFCAIGASRMGFLSSKKVKKTLREAIYTKLLKLGAAYKEQIRTSEIVQVAVEGVDQLETYFGAYLPQFFYAMPWHIFFFVFLREHTFWLYCSSVFR